MTYTLQCLFERDSNPFPIDIDLIQNPNTTIGHLKEAIAPKINISLAEAKNIILRKISIPDETANLGQFTPTEQPNFCIALPLPGRKIVDIFGTPAENHIHVFIERPEQESPRNWQSYTAIDNQAVHLPPKIFAMLNDNKFIPKPRTDFLKVLQNVQVGQSITLPFLGQHPKHFGQGYQGTRFFITQQMIDMWHMLSLDQPHSIKRVLSGPMGVGKSYLALFLAAKAYSENWPMLYISDAADLNKPTQEQSSELVCKLFLAINKDILPANTLKHMVRDVKAEDVALTCVGEIWELLKQRSSKTLLVVDEHSWLFNVDPIVPTRLPFLIPLLALTFWGEADVGARVVLTGIDTKFERKYLINGMNNWIEFVGPMPEDTFDSLIRLHPLLKQEIIVPKVRKITNCVPRELMELDKHMKNLDGNYIPGANNIDELLITFRKDRSTTFLNTATNYFESLDIGSKLAYRKALSNMFLRSSDIMTSISFDWKFLDTGLVYRFKDEYSYVKYKPLCPAALDALLDVYTAFPLPRDVTIASLNNGQLTGNNFEEVLFQQLLKYQNILFKVTDIAGNYPSTMHIKFKHFTTFENNQHAPGPEHSESLIRAYAGYPRFDFMIGPIFIQVSVSSFDRHNSGSANIERAFSPIYEYGESKQKVNQIELYLNTMFGHGHYAYINEERRFIVTKNNILVPGFRIVYICGSPGAPNHTQLVRKYPDIAFIDYEELKTKLFGDFLRDLRM